MSEHCTIDNADDLLDAPELETAAAGSASVGATLRELIGQLRADIAKLTLLRDESSGDDRERLSATIERRQRLIAQLRGFLALARES